MGMHKDRNKTVKDMNKHFKNLKKHHLSTGFTPSAKSDNYHFCSRANRSKYCYDTLQKATRALEYNPQCSRAYWCKSCCAYHLTSKSKEEYWDELDRGFRKRFGVAAGRALDKNQESA